MHQPDPGDSNYPTTRNREIRHRDRGQNFTGLSQACIEMPPGQLESPEVGFVGRPHRRCYPEVVAAVECIWDKEINLLTTRDEINSFTFPSSAPSPALLKIARLQ